MGKRITVEEFVKEYKDIQDRNSQKELVKGIIHRTYAPILEKKVALQSMMNHAVFEDGVIKYIDMTLSKVNFIMAIVGLYTTLNIIHEKDDTKSNFDDYDSLRESGVINDIQSIIGDNEIQELLSVNKSIMDTFYNQNSSAEAFVTKSINRFAKFTDVFFDGLKKINTKDVLDVAMQLINKDDN